MCKCPYSGEIAELRREQAKMVINYWRQAEKAAEYGIILGIDAQRHPLRSKSIPLKDDPGPMSTAGKPHPIPIARHL